MRNLLPLVTLIFIGMSILASLILFNSFSRIGKIEKAKIVSVEVFTDKERYTSGEEVKIQVIAYSNRPLNATLRLEGIQGKIKVEKKIKLDSGINQFSFSFKLPKCNVCGGIKPGTKKIKCEILWDNSSVQAFSELEVLK